MALARGTAGNIRPVLVVALALSLIAVPVSGSDEASLLATALDSENHLIQDVVRKSDQHELQVLLTVLENDDIETATRYQYRLNSKHYFYPASTVKLPIALLAAEFVARQPALELGTPYSLSGRNQTFTIKEDIRLVFAISDDDAYNRLYEIIGRDYANERLGQLGYTDSRIVHRLAVRNADAPQRRAATFYTSNGAKTFKGSDQAVRPIKLDGIKKGKGYIKDGTLISEPFDFSLKNSFPVEDQHRLLSDIVFASNSNFDLGKTEQEFLLQAMRLTPSAAGFKDAEYFDGYAKFFLYGDTRDALAEHINIYNKVGYAYGTLTDNAYIKDDISFMLTATLKVNKNEIFNDDNYEYDSVGLPFLAQLGREIYTLLLKQTLDQE